MRHNGTKMDTTKDIPVISNVIFEIVEISLSLD
jgi:hypothetical protein